MALIDADDAHHSPLRAAYEAAPHEWVLPWAILPEVDHVVASRLGEPTARAFRRDLADGAFLVEWGVPADLVRAAALDARYADLRLGLVDGAVMAVAERLRARAIATLDLRDFGPVKLEGSPALWPRDL